MALSVAELRDMPVTEPDWLIKGLLTRQNTMVMIGPPKTSGKSWLLLALAWDLCEGRPAWGIKTFETPRPQRVVFFTQEDTDIDIRDRAVKHIKSGREVNDRLWVVPKNLEMTLDTRFDMILTEVKTVVQKAGAVDLVIFDPLRRMMSGDEIDSRVIAAIWGRLDKLHKEFGCSTILAHHVRKPPQDKSNYDPTDFFNGRGSSDIYGGGDAFAICSPQHKDERQGEVDVYYETKRAATPAPNKFIIDYETAQVQMAGDPTKLDKKGGAKGLRDY